MVLIMLSSDLDVDVIVDNATLTGAATVGLGRFHAATYSAMTIKFGLRLLVQDHRSVYMCGVCLYQKNIVMFWTLISQILLTVKMTAKNILAGIYYCRFILGTFELKVKSGVI